LVRVHVASPNEQRRGGMAQQIKQQRRYSGTCAGLSTTW
jgi:hypothetical protein